jgi:hypothetical protein
VSKLQDPETSGGVYPLHTARGPPTFEQAGWLVDRFFDEGKAEIDA